MPPRPRETWPLLAGLRGQLRRRAAAPAPRRLWMEPAIIVWLLGVFSTGLIPWMYSKYKIGQERDEKIRKLDVEIEWRYSQFITDIEEHVVKNPPGNTQVPVYPDKLSLVPGTAPTFIPELWERLKAPPSAAHGFSIYGELKDRSLLSLVYELRTMFEEGDPEAETLRRIAVNLLTVRKLDFSGDDLGPMLRAFQHDFLLPRWSKSAPYTDCRGFPFC